MNQYIETFKKWSDYSGRASRREYWGFYFVNILIFMVIGFIFGLTTSIMKINITDKEFDAILSILELIIIVPMAAVGVRRMHDTNRSGRFLLIPIYNIYLALAKGDAVPNRFGEVPKK